MIRASLTGIALLAILPLSLAAIVVHARSVRASRKAEMPAIELVATRLPGAGLALSGGARWLRQPGLEEPGAPFVDAIAAPDPDPAGAAFAPPPNDVNGPR
ncbi:hypothetical protein BH09MYX1_BH09MYX1_34090 [soil metagenome]